VSRTSSLLVLEIHSIARLHRWRSVYLFQRLPCRVTSIAGFAFGRAPVSVEREICHMLGVHQRPTLETNSRAALCQSRYGSSEVAICDEPNILPWRFYTRHTR